jgi:hypothetical protein
VMPCVAVYVGAKLYAAPAGGRPGAAHNAPMMSEGVAMLRRASRRRGGGRRGATSKPGSGCCIRQGMRVAAAFGVMMDFG